MKTIYTKWWLVYVLTFISSMLQAADITVTVKGKVVAKPCTVSTRNTHIDLGDLYTFNLVQAGSSSIWHIVPMDLTDCPAGTSRVTATFSGMTDSTGYYKNEGSAENIQLELQDDMGITLSNGAKKVVSVQEATQSVHFPLQIRALTVKGRATQGTIQAVINITYTYA